MSPRGVAAAALGFAAILPLFLAQGGSAMENLVLAAAYVVMALGLNVVVGFAGLLDLGYVAFFAIGAHVAAHFGSGFWADAGDGAGVALFVGEPAAGLPGIHFNFLIILVLAIAATTIAGVLIGVPTLRLRGDYVGIVTLAFGEIIGQVAANGREIELFGGSLTAGPGGISAIDRIDLPFLERFGPFDLASLVLVRPRTRRTDAVRQLQAARLEGGEGVDRDARRRGTRRGAWAFRSCARSCWRTESEPRWAARPAPSSRRT